MQIDTHYQPQKIEQCWYQYWLENNFFASKPDPEKEPYTIVIPPPNVTGILHMGHMLNNTIQDVLARYHRMDGKNVCWVPGTDHASIATEAKVVARLKEKKIKKSDLTREQFLEEAWAWTHQYGGIILEQLKKLGASCDWKRTTFTMDEGYSDAVIKVFVDLYEKGLIYRGLRMVNWDPAALTALSDEEVIFKDESSTLYHIRYEGADEEGFLTIATQRPETIFADAAICFHPEDNRYKKWMGKKVKIPLIGREIPVIADPYVDPAFGTGCLKVTPAHDKNDHVLGKKHQLPIIDLLHPDGKLNQHGGVYQGQDRFEARKNIVKDLEAKGFLEKKEDYFSRIGYSERTHVVVEPRLSMQWFCKMKDLAQPAIEFVEKEEVRFFPDKFKNTYHHWMNNIQDWCISRQLWWGHRIPAYFFGAGENDFVVATTAEKALDLARKKTQNSSLTLADLKQDEDAMDTWFSSWIWPLEVFQGISNPLNADFLYYYPTNDLVTAPEILFFWVARMVMAGAEFVKKKPFSNVYLTGIVRDKLGRKMSKSLGNSPDPLDLIAKYGADAVRVGMLFSSPAGNDLLFDEALCEQGRNFAGKIWNAFRLIKGFPVEKTAADPMKAPQNKEVIDWFKSKANQALGQFYGQFEQFRISEALMTLYKLFWDDFCAWYLELIKPPFGQPIDRYTYDQTIGIFSKLLTLLHPFMPFITEEIFHHLEERKQGDSISLFSLPENGEVDETLLKDFVDIQNIIVELRTLRVKNQIHSKETLKLQWKNQNMLSWNQNKVRLLGKILNKNQAELEIIPQNIDKNQSLLQDFSKQIKTGQTQNQMGLHLVAAGLDFFIPRKVEAKVLQAETSNIQKEIEYLEGFVAITKQKIENPQFLEKAPAVLVAKENQKILDATAKIALLKSKLKEISHQISASPPTKP